METRLNQTILQGVGCRWHPVPLLYNGCLHGNKLSKPQARVKCNGLALIAPKPRSTLMPQRARNDGAERDKFATTSFDPDKPVAMPVIQLAAPSDAGAAVLSRVK
jgi:hypothetical protein